MAKRDEQVHYNYSPSSGYGGYAYSYNPFQTLQTTQKSYSEQEGAFGYLHTVATTAEGYFDGSYRGVYFTSDNTTYEGRTIPADSSYYTQRTYQDAYGYTSYSTQHS